MPFKLLGKKNGKRTVSDDIKVTNDTVKVTKVLKFLPEVEPKKATIRSIVRFLWNPGNGITLCWLQGEIAERVDKYDYSKEKRWKTNKVKVKDLKVVNYWGDDCPEPLSCLWMLHGTRRVPAPIRCKVTSSTQRNQ